jgi:hypothetical protein
VVRGVIGHFRVQKWLRVQVRVQVGRRWVFSKNIIVSKSNHVREQGAVVLLKFKYK